MMLNEWTNFFLGELGAAAALSGLLFVSVSVNQARILQLGRMADRGIEALLMLLLVLVVASLTLVPGQPLRLLGAEILGIGTMTLVAGVALQQVYLRDLEPIYRRQSIYVVAVNRLAVTLIALAGAVVLWRGDGVGIYLLPPGILLSFLAAGANAWVLLIEINR
jgi:modulator of FtsH protease